jgi:lipopolysaccharide heptosyltransferase II
MVSKTLVVGPSWLGDTVMSQSLFKALAAQDCVIDVMAPTWCHPVLARMPQVRQAISMDFAHGELGWAKRRQHGQQLKSQQYDQAFVLPNSWKSALIPWFAGIKRRVGWRGEQRWWLLNDIRRLDKQKMPMMVERYVALAFEQGWTSGDYPRPALHIDKQTIPPLLDQLGLAYPTASVVILCPGASFGQTCRWPVNYFAVVAKQLLEQGKQVWLYGSLKERVLANQIQILTKQRCVDLTGLPLGEAIDLMTLATSVITNDSGFMHVAAALDIPTVAMYGCTSPEYTPPLSEHAYTFYRQLDCQPCMRKTCPLGHLACLYEITPAQVLQAANESFNR